MGSISPSGMRALGTEGKGRDGGTYGEVDCCPAERALVPGGVHTAWCEGTHAKQGG